MKNLQEATERICELKGSMSAMDALLTALLQQLPPGAREGLGQAFGRTTEVARTVMLHAPVSDLTVDAFERDVARMAAFMQRPPAAGA